MPREASARQGPRRAGRHPRRRLRRRRPAHAPDRPLRRGARRRRGRLMLVAPDGDLRVMASSSEAMRVAGALRAAGPGRPVPRLLPHRASRSSARTSPRPTSAGPGSRPRHSPLVSAPSRRCRCASAAPCSARSTCSTCDTGEMRPADLDSRPGPRRRRHHRHPPASGHPGDPAAQRAAHPRAQQPHRDRAGQGRGRRAGEPRHGAGLRRPAQPRPQPQPPARRRGLRRHRRHAPSVCPRPSVEQTDLRRQDRPLDASGGRQTCVLTSGRSASTRTSRGSVRRRGTSR